MKYKPPTINWILLKFYKYDILFWKILRFKISTLSLVKMLVYEKCSVYLYYINTKYFNYYYCFKNNNFIFLTTIFLEFFSFSNETYKKIKNNPFSIFLIFFFFLIIKHFSRRNIFNLGLKKLYPLQLDREESVTVFSIKNLLLKQNFYVKNIFNIFSMSHFYSFNIYYIIALIHIFRIYPNISLLKWKKIFYYEKTIRLSFFQNFFEKKIGYINHCISMRKGIIKKSNFFITKHFLLSTSMQLVWATVSLYLWYFFKNSDYCKFTQHDIKLVTSEESNLHFGKFGIYLWDRYLTIITSCVGKLFYVHTGDWFTPLKITPGMVGRKFGEFSFTWKIYNKNK